MIDYGGSCLFSSAISVSLATSAGPTSLLLIPGRPLFACPNPFTLYNCGFGQLLSVLGDLAWTTIRVYECLMCVRGECVLKRLGGGIFHVFYAQEGFEDGVGTDKRPLDHDNRRNRHGQVEGN